MSNAAFTVTRPCLVTKASISTIRSSRCDRPFPNFSILPSLTYRSSSIHVRHEAVSCPLLSRDRIAILWLRMGHLRLADNPALRAASHYKGRLITILTLQRREADDSVLSAVAEIARKFHIMGNKLITRITDSLQDEMHAVIEIASKVDVSKVIVNLSPEFEQIPLTSLSNSVKFEFWNGSLVETDIAASRSFPIHDPPLSQPPHTLPRPPQIARELRSDVLPSSYIGKTCETTARKRLAQLLRAPETKLGTILARLVTELRIGCLAAVRVKVEFTRAQRTSNSSHGQPIPRCLSFLQAFFTSLARSPAISALSIAAYDVNGGDRRGVEWDDSMKSFVLKEWEHQETERRMKPRERVQEFIRRRQLFFKRSFFPDDVTPDYYSFTAWRFAQRCVSATIGVFGTSSLLFALGIRSGRIGQAAVISWVLKDGLGRVGKMLWAGSMGKDFDVDPKRWRFRSAMLYALGNGLEIVTQIFPASFLVFATAANSMKQVSMLTSSATRNAMYRSFGGRSQNIANITAKGEAQIVVADLIGMGCGIRLSKFVSASRRNILGVYAGLTLLDIFGIYMELRQVVFRTVNAERSHVLIRNYVKEGLILSPSEVSPMERIFLKPTYKRQIRMSSIAKAAQNPQELDLLLKVFRREHFIVSTPGSPSGGPCRLVLRRDSSNEDVLRAMLMVGYVQQAVKQRSDVTPLTIEEQENVLRSAWKKSKKHFPIFLAGMKTAGWNTDNLLFSTMKRRGYW